MTDDNVIPLRRKGDPPPMNVDMILGPPPSKRMQTAALLASHTGRGITVKELIAHTGWHHGAASAQLSWFHQHGAAVRLQEKRDGCSVYVHPDWVEERKISPRRMNQQGLLDGMARALERKWKPCKHGPTFGHPTCHQCEVYALLKHYKEVRGSSH